MAFFSRKKKEKKKQGKTSNLTTKSSPYRTKIPTDSKRSKKTPRYQRNQKSALRAPRGMNTKQSNGKFKTILAIILSLGILGFLLYAIFFSQWFLIKKFVLVEKGTVVESYEKMNEVLKKIIGENLILLQDDQIIQEMKTLHPEIQTIRIKKIFPETLRIEYEKYPTVANLVNIVSGIQKKFLIDSQGFLIEENVDQPDLPHIHIETAQALTIRSNFLSDPLRSREKLTYIRNAINLYEEKFGMKILYAEFYPVEREVHLYTEKFFFVLLDMEKNLNRQIEKLRQSLTKLDIYNDSLLYIDLRISGSDTEKIIFKRK